MLCIVYARIMDASRGHWLKRICNVCVLDSRDYDWWARKMICSCLYTSSQISKWYMIWKATRYLYRNYFKLEMVSLRNSFAYLISNIILTQLLYRKIVGNIRQAMDISKFTKSQFSISFDHVKIWDTSDFTKIHESRAYLCVY